jgi:stringent starvation protein B
VTDVKMTSTRPYLVRALYEWIVDNQCTPYLLVNALDPATRVPQEYVKDGQIILNLSPTAIRGLVMDNERIEFSARFGGVARSLYVPLSAVMAIYAKENGKGMFFDPSEEVAPPRPVPGRPASVPDPVRSAESGTESGAIREPARADQVGSALAAVSSPAVSTPSGLYPVDSGGADDGGEPGDGKPGGGKPGGGKPGKGKGTRRPSLKVVK